MSLLTFTEVSLPTSVLDFLMVQQSIFLGTSDYQVLVPTLYLHNMLTIVTSNVLDRYITIAISTLDMSILISRWKRPWFLFGQLSISWALQSFPLRQETFRSCSNWVWSPVPWRVDLAEVVGQLWSKTPQNSRRNENKWQFQAEKSFSMSFPWLPWWFSGKLFPIPFLFPPSQMLQPLEVAEVREGAGGISATSDWFQEQFWSVSVPRDVFMVFLGTLW